MENEKISFDPLHLTCGTAVQVRVSPLTVVFMCCTVLVFAKQLMFEQTSLNLGLQTNKGGPAE